MTEQRFTQCHPMPQPSILPHGMWLGKLSPRGPSDHSFHPQPSLHCLPGGQQSPLLHGEALACSVHACQVLRLTVLQAKNKVLWEGASGWQLPAPFYHPPHEASVSRTGSSSSSWLSVCPAHPGAERKVEFLSVGGGSYCFILGYSTVFGKT